MSKFFAGHGVDSRSFVVAHSQLRRVHEGSPHREPSSIRLSGSFNTRMRFRDSDDWDLAALISVRSPFIPATIAVSI